MKAVIKKLILKIWPFRKARPSFADYLLNCPIDPDDLPKRRPARVPRRNEMDSEPRGDGRRL